MSRNVHKPIPTLGYPTQKAACVALALEGHRPKDIAAMTGASVNTVHRCISEFRRSLLKQKGEAKALKLPEPKPADTLKESYTRDDKSIWSMSEDDRRQAIARRAAKAARAARLAA